MSSQTSPERSLKIVTNARKRRLRGPASQQVSARQAFHRLSSGWVCEIDPREWGARRTVCPSMTSIAPPRL
jgi:hypothetical protein